MKALERQNQRKRIYSFTAFFGVVGIGVMLLAMVHGTARRQVAQFYRDPVKALHTIIALKEALHKRDAGRYATIEELVKKGDISEELLEGPVQGYLYRSPLADTDHFVITADPVGPAPPPPPVPPGQTAREFPRYHYVIDETGTVRGDLVTVTSASLVFFSPRDSGPR